MNEYLSVAQYCEKYSLDGGHVRRLIAAGRINAVKIGTQWAIPTDEPKPSDNRVICRSITPPTTGSRIKKSCSRFRLLHFTAKPSALLRDRL